MKVVQVITRRQMRGAEVFATQLADGISSNGVETTLVSLYGPTQPPLETGNLKTIDVDHTPGRGLRPGRLRRLVRILGDECPDLVQANGSDTLKYTVLARRLSRLDFPIVYRNIGMPGAWLRGSLHSRVNRWLLSNVDRIAAVSDASRGEIARRYGINGDKVATIPIGTELPVRLDRGAGRAHLEATVGPLGSNTVLMTVASLTEEKNVGGLLRAFGRVDQKFGNPRLVVIGDGPLRRDLEETARLLGIDDRVHFLGTRRDVGELLHAADVFLLFSNTEGLPGVLLEAAAHGLPMIATDVGGVAEIVEDDVSGVLVGARDEDAMATAISSLIRDPQRRDDLGQSARDLVTRKYDIELITQSFLALYHDLLGVSG